MTKYNIIVNNKETKIKIKDLKNGTLVRYNDDKNSYWIISDNLESKNFNAINLKGEIGIIVDRHDITVINNVDIVIKD